MSLVLKKAISKYRTTFFVQLFADDRLGGAPSSVLPFNMQKQLQNQWCWAATSTSVSLFYNSASAWTQCLVAKQIMKTDCCFDATPCNKSWYLDEALSVTKNLNVESAPLNFNQVSAELNMGRVIGARIGWQEGGGHFMVIYGCKTVDGINYFYIDDPIYGKSELSETAFANSYQGSGRWTHSFTTKP